MTTAQFENKLDNPPAYCVKVAELWEWSRNYDHPTPLGIFLDLIGYSVEHYGEALTNPADWRAPDYYALDYIGEALREYIHRPADVEEWITETLEAEISDDDGEEESKD